jgi:MoxR-like ATPase
MLQKDALGQDMFLIGPPGPQKFKIAHLYAQLVNQEIEYIALSRDTTESDLKQRREIHNGSARFEDQVQQFSLISCHLNFYFSATFFVLF